MQMILVFIQYSPTPPPPFFVCFVTGLLFNLRSVCIIFSCVKGMIPKVGDRVFVEASYNPAMPFKWNATRVQVLSNTQVRDDKCAF